jgi:hypothetical protein
MEPQNQNYDFEERHNTQTSNSLPRPHLNEYVPFLKLLALTLQFFDNVF